MAEKNYNVRINYGKMLSTLVDNLGTITVEQVAELIKKQLKRQNASVSYNEEIMKTAIKRAKKDSLYRTQDFNNGTDILVSLFGEQGHLPIIPCFWVLEDMFKDEHLDVDSVFKGRNPEVFSYSTENITYSFYYVTEENLGIMRKSIDTAKYYASLNEKTRSVKFHLINVYVTNSFDVADTIGEMTKDVIKSRVAIIKTEKSPYEKPSQIAYYVDGNRVE